MDQWFLNKIEFITSNPFNPLLHYSSIPSPKGNEREQSYDGGGGLPIKIRVVNLFKSFAEKEVLHGVNLEVRQGESMVVIGGSGSGKTVLIKCIIGLIQPDEGEIYVDGQEISFIERTGDE